MKLQQKQTHILEMENILREKTFGNLSLSLLFTKKQARKIESSKKKTKKM
jgi:hypothetical protein